MSSGQEEAYIHGQGEIFILFFHKTNMLNTMNPITHIYTWLIDQVGSLQNRQWVFISTTGYSPPHLTWRSVVEWMARVDKNSIKIPGTQYKMDG